MNQATKASPLGRGLSALFGDADASYQAKPSQTATPAPTTKPGNSSPSHMALTWLQPGAFQPRRHFDEDALKGLADSIRERGILEPLVVRPISGTKESFEIVAGERRWRAAQRAGLHEAPVVVRNLTDREALEFGLIENVQRQDLSPLEEAEGYKRLMDEFQHTQEGLAKIVGKSRPHIANMLRILNLPEAVKQMIARWQHHARSCPRDYHRARSVSVGAGNRQKGSQCSAGGIARETLQREPTNPQAQIIRPKRRYRRARKRARTRHRPKNQNPDTGKIWLADGLLSRARAVGRAGEKTQDISDHCCAT